MIGLPNYDLLDFLVWFSEKKPKSSFEILINDRNVAMKYVTEYLKTKYDENEIYDYKKCQRFIKRIINQAIECEEFKQILRESCCNRDCCNECVNCFYEYLGCYLNRRIPKRPTYNLKRIDPEDFLQRVYDYLNQNGIMHESRLMEYMVGCSETDFSSILDFMDWLSQQEDKILENIYKIPKPVLDDVIKNYELSRGEKLSSGQKKKIIKCFNNKLPEQIEDWFYKIIGKKHYKKLNYIFDRFYNSRAKYKCILLPLKAESDFVGFVKEYWIDLNAASSDFLDIFYSFDELKDTGYHTLKKIKNLKINTNELPCVVIWKNDISEAKAIDIRGLKNSDICTIMQNIIYYIKAEWDLRKIYEKVSENVASIRNNKREIMMQQNINVNGSNNVTINATQNNKVQGTATNELDEIMNVIRKNMDAVRNAELKEELKEDILDAIESIKEQLEKEKPKESRIRNGIKLLAPTVSLLNGIPQLRDNLQELIELVLNTIK